MYNYTPQRENSASLTVPILLFIGAGVSFAASSFGIGIRLIWQLLAMVMLVAGIQITTRFRLSSFTYVIDSDGKGGVFEDELNRVAQNSGESGGQWLRIVRTQGKNSRTVAGFPLSAVISVVQRGDSSPSDSDVRYAYNYCNNLFPKNARKITLTLNGKLIRITLEPDEYILSLLMCK